jgi:hypothetical protein
MVVHRLAPCCQDFPHTLNIVNFEPATGQITGTGTQPDFQFFGELSGSNITLHIIYLNSSYFADLAGIVASDGSMSGTFTDNLNQSGTWTATLTQRGLSWSLAKDFGANPTANPARGSYGVYVWSFLQSSSFAHDRTYSLLPHYSNQFAGVSGLSAWYGDITSSTCIGFVLPVVGINTTSSSQNPPCTPTVPAGTVFVHPANPQMAIVGWQSPTSGTVTISGGVADDDATCGDGIRWYVDLDAATIASGAILNGGSASFPTGLQATVHNGSVLYFIVDPGASGNINCDTTRLDVTIVAGTASGLPGAPQGLQVTPLNGQADVRWFPPATNANLVTGYTITAQPVGNNRVPQPIVAATVHTNKASELSVLMKPLLADCHQLYKVSVRATSAGGDGPAATSSLFRPSGIVAQGKEPPYVVILLDGIAESKPYFNFNPYQPTRDNTPSYCPESVTSSGAEAEADFRGAPNGPWEFFNKWNFADLGGDPTLSCSTDSSGNASPAKCSNSTPRDLFTQIPTHWFMLDAIAAEGSIILPYSYNGATLTGPSSNPSFNFPAYSVCESTPKPVPTASNLPPCRDQDRRQIYQDVFVLDQEISSIHQVWQHTKIVIVGHSQGGLIASDWWFGGDNAFSGDDNNPGTTTNNTGVTNVFTLDSPINGVCTSAACLNVPGYPDFNPAQTRFARDRDQLRRDAAAGYPVRFVGTFGDTVPIPPGGFGAYGLPGPDNLQHELLVTGSQCAVSINYTADCPPPADHISGCPIVPGSPGWVEDDQHFITKFCPDNVAYFNSVIGLSY